MLLVVALWVFALSAPSCRTLLRQPGWYLANAVFLLVIAPDIVWNATQWTESYLHRDLVLASAGQGLSLKPLSLYLGDWFRGILGPNAFGEDYLEGNLLVCHAAAGVLYLAAILAASRAWRVAAVRCLLIVFWLVFAVFLFLPGGGFHEPFWWASISLIPAVVCGGVLMERLTHGSRLRTAIGLSAVALLAVNEAFVIRAPGRYEPRVNGPTVCRRLHRARVRGPRSQRPPRGRGPIRICIEHRWAEGRCLPRARADRARAWPPVRRSATPRQVSPTGTEALESPGIEPRDRRGRSQ